MPQHVFARDRVRNRDSLYSGAVDVIGPPAGRNAPRGVKPYMVNIYHHSISCRGRRDGRSDVGTAIDKVCT